MRRFGRSMLWTLAILLALTAWGGARPAHATLVTYAIIFHPVLGPAPTGFITVNNTCTFPICVLGAGSVPFFDVKDPGLPGAPEWTLADPRTSLSVVVSPSNLLAINYINGQDTIPPPAVPTSDRLNLTGPIDLYSIFTSSFSPLGAGTYELRPVPEAPPGATSLVLAALGAAWLASRRRTHRLAR
jgi:hypothetical protein